jgi:hypothetical protein
MTRTTCVLVATSFHRGRVHLDVGGGLGEVREVRRLRVGGVVAPEAPPGRTAAMMCGALVTLARAVRIALSEFDHHA